MLTNLHAKPAHALPRVRLRSRAIGCKTASRKNSSFSRLHSHVRCALASTAPRETALFPVASMSGALVLRFPGQYFDSETNLHHNTFRSYQPTQGRYTQGDPIGLDGGWNRMGYVGGNPLSFIDPLGLKKIILLPPEDPNYPAAINYPDDPTKCIVIAHGSTQSVNRMNAQQLNRLLTQNGCKKEPVRIDACRTGQGDNSIAEQLSRIRGVTVVAPTELTWTTPWGGNFSSPYPPMSEDRDSLWNGVPNLTRPGDWRQFDPPVRGRK